MGATRKRSAPPSDSARLSVLVIADDPDVRESLAEWCTAEGFEVGTLADPAAAIKWIRSTEVHLLMLDLDLRTPKFDALELLRQIREVDDDVEIVVMPGGVPWETLSGAIQYRLAACMSPRSTREELHEMVVRIARRHPLSARQGESAGAATP